MNLFRKTPSVEADDFFGNFSNGSGVFEPSLNVRCGQGENDTRSRECRLTVLPARCYS
jgi:hypothetical protein